MGGVSSVSARVEVVVRSFHAHATILTPLTCTVRVRPLSTLFVVTIASYSWFME